jgi:hypothetical protein
MSATFNSINESLEYIKTGVPFLINEEKKIMDKIREIKTKNDEYRSNISQEQQQQEQQQEQLRDPEMPQLQLYESQQLPPLHEIQSICSNVISRINTLREYEHVLTRISESLYITLKISIKNYISRCKKENMKDCYDKLDTELQLILFKYPSQKPKEQLTIFKKGYLLYDLIRLSDKDKFRRMLTDERTTYNEIRHEPQIGGAKSTLLQVIGLTKIIAILSYFSKMYKSEFKIITSTDKGIQPIQPQQYVQNDSKDSQGVNIFYLLNDEKKPQYEGELTAEECLQIYKNGGIINTIVSFFYTEPIIPKP